MDPEEQNVQYVYIYIEREICVCVKINAWCDRLGSSLASTWGGPFFDVHKVGAPVELQKCSKTS